MSKWHDWLEVDFVGPREWVLTEPLTFEVEKFRVPDMVATLADWKQMDIQFSDTPDSILITVPVGYHTDLASVSRAMWSILAPWDVARGAVVHDALYGAIRKCKEAGTMSKEHIKRLRRQADDIFKLGMDAADPKVPNWKIVTCYYSVRSFGWTSIMKKAKFAN
jgi:hypothetical protein